MIETEIAKTLVKDILDLPEDKIFEVRDFIHFLKLQTNRSSIPLHETGLSKEQANDLRNRLSTFIEDWDKPEMDIYNGL